MKMWLLFTFILTCVSIWSVFQVNVLGDNLNVEECQVEVKMAGLPNLSVVEREEEVIIEKKVEVLDFPFEVVDKGVMTVKGSCSDCLPNKEYPKMRSKEVITAFASKDVLPEGTLVWIENVGIRQILEICHIIQCCRCSKRISGTNNLCITVNHPQIIKQLIHSTRSTIKRQCHKNQHKGICILA